MQARALQLHGATRSERALPAAVQRKLPDGGLRPRNMPHTAGRHVRKGRHVHQGRLVLGYDAAYRETRHVRHGGPSNAARVGGTCVSSLCSHVHCCPCRACPLLFCAILLEPPVISRRGKPKGQITVNLNFKPAKVRSAHCTVCCTARHPVAMLMPACLALCR
eukprot:scaffold4147_cov412-Prasinococcus_capsulatus_cf.AAC.9